MYYLHILENCSHFGYKIYNVSAIATSSCVFSLFQTPWLPQNRPKEVT